MKPSVSRVIDAVSRSFKVSRELILRPDGVGARFPDRVLARHVAMYACRRTIVSRPWASSYGMPISYPEIGRAFGRDHTTVIYAIRSIERQMAEDWTLKCRVETSIDAILSTGDWPKTQFPTSCSVLQAA